MEVEQDLRSASDEMLRTLDQLQRLELEKREQKPGTASFVKLATEIEKLAAMVFAATNVQQTIAERAKVASERGADLRPIEEIDAARDVSVILSEWREAERSLASTGLETAEHAKAAADVRRLREEYHRAHRAQAKRI